MKNEQLKSAFNESIEIIKEYSKSFYQGFKLLPREKFHAVAALYAFFRTADDLADEAEEGTKNQARESLQDLEQDIEALDQGDQVTSTYRWWPAFEKTVKEFQIPKDGFIMQIHGQYSDLNFQDLQTLDDLINYSRLVAGSVGRAMLPILAQDPEDGHNPELLSACEGLGIAMQITNILRDVGEDLRERNRLYLPASLLDDHGLTKEDLQKFSVGDLSSNKFSSFVDLWEKLAHLSEDLYDRFDQYLSRLDKDARLPVYASALIYRGILDEVRAADYNCFTKKQYTSKAKKIQLIHQAKQNLKELK